jgi:outer membrane protein assembly factor BamB
MSKSSGVSGRRDGPPPRASSTVLLSACLLVVLGSGCGQVNYSSGASSKSAESAAVASAAGAAARIPENVLNGHGLETIWTQETLSGTLRHAFVAGDDIYAVEERRAGDGRNAIRRFILVDFKRSDGLRRWEWELKAPLKHAPYIHRYSPSAQRRDDELFLVQKDDVHCLDLQHGITLWQKSLPISISSGVVASDGQFFVGSADGRYFGFPKNSDIETWFWFTDGEVKTDGFVASDMTYFTSSKGSVYRLQVERGKRDRRAWTFKAGSAIHGAPTSFIGHVYAGSSDYKLYALRDIDGSIDWSFQAQAPILDTPLAVSYRANLPLILAISDDPRPAVNKRILWAVNAAQGSLVWKADHVSEVIAVGRRSVFVALDARAGRGRVLAALDGDTGKEQFSLSLDGFDFVPSSAAAQKGVESHRSLVYLIHRSGFIQAIGERL